MEACRGRGDSRRSDGAVRGDCRCSARSHRHHHQVAALGVPAARARVCRPTRSSSRSPTTASSTCCATPATSRSSSVIRRPTATFAARAGPSTPPRGPRASARSTGSTRTSRVARRSARAPCRTSTSATRARSSSSPASRNKYKDAWQQHRRPVAGQRRRRDPHRRRRRRARRSSRRRPADATTSTTASTPVFDYSGGATPANLAGQLLPRLQHRRQGRRGGGQGRVLGQPDRRRRRGDEGRGGDRRQDVRARGAVRVVAGGGQRAPARRHAEHAVPEPRGAGPHGRRQRGRRRWLAREPDHATRS